MLDMSAYFDASFYLCFYIQPLTDFPVRASPPTVTYNVVYNALAGKIIQKNKIYIFK
jgi:hypothetical protein